MRPLMVAEPILRAPRPEIVSESTKTEGVCANAFVPSTKIATNNSGIDCVFMKIPFRGLSSAMPLDVRKVSDLPAGDLINELGCAQSGHSPKGVVVFRRWGLAATAHRAAEPLLLRLLGLG